MQKDLSEWVDTGKISLDASILREISKAITEN